MTLASLFPRASIDIVEIDAAVVRVARRFFGFAEATNMQVHVQDARVFIKRAQQHDTSYDMIILDAFTGEYIPEHLMTQEFLQETKSILTEVGVLIANTFSNSRLYDHESVTYQRVFKHFFNFKLPGTGNRVIIASNASLPSQFMLQNRAKMFSAKLQRYGVDIEKFPQSMRREIDWDISKRPLTDQYSPANLLQKSP